MDNMIPLHGFPHSLLVRLLATVDDTAIFDLSGSENPDAFKDELREIFEQLFQTALACFQRSRDPWQDWDAPHPGAALIKHYGVLQSCWVDDFSDAIRNVAGQADLADTDSRDFCHFMLGVLWCAKQEYNRQRRVQPGQNTGEGQGR